MKSIKKNLVYQFLYQFLILVIPFIISPYLTRILGKENLGIYSYVNSIAFYFVMISMLGISNYGTRSISMVKDNELELRKTFWNLFFLHCISSGIALVSYSILCFSVLNTSVGYLHLLYVLSALFDITWLFYGLEEFKSIVLKNTFIKVLELVLIFTLVKDVNDLPIYTAIMCASYLLGNLVIIPSAIKKVKFIKPDWKLILKHLKPVLILSIYTLSTGIYSVLDKTILGIFCEKAEVGIYDYGEKLIKIINTILTTVGTVMLPRMSYLFEKKDKDKLIKYISYSFIGIGFLAFGSVFGILGVADDFILLYYGEDFIDCSFVMKSLTPIILIVSLGNIVRTQYILPSKKDKMYVASFAVSMIINAIIDFALIPFIGINGAIIGTIVAELTSVLIQFISVCKEIPILKFLCKTLPFLLSGLIMFIVLFILNYYKVFSSYHVSIRLLLEFIIGAVIYILVSIAFAYTLLRKDTKAIVENLLHRKKTEEITENQLGE